MRVMPRSLAIGLPTVLALVLMALSPTYPCVAPKRGSGWTAEELITRSPTILLVELKESHRTEFLIENVLVPVEALKGTAPSEVRFFTGTHHHYDDDFDQHRDPLFWKPNVGRSPWPCCICGPDHTFTEGERYFVFPDAFGAAKSAELIRTIEDRWYVHVKARLSEPSGPSSP